MIHLQARISRRSFRIALGGILTGIILLGPASEVTAALKEDRPSLRKLARQIRSGIKALADDSMEGRGLDTKGILLAASWIETRLRETGLEPAFEGSYRQTFPVKIGVERTEGNEVDGLGEEDWTPLGFSSSGEFSGEMAFAGYGIEAESVGFQELKGLDLKGKVVLMLRYEPQERDEASPFNGKKPSRWSSMRYKVLQARERGAAAVIFASGPVQDEGRDKLPVLKNDGPKSPAGIPVIQIKTSVAEKWLAEAGLNLEDFQRQVDHDLTPRSMGSTGIRVSGRVALNATYAQTGNLAGVIPGKGPLAQEYVVVGAHYDHLGWGGEGSMKPNLTAIHNGADDNASGVVSALLIGRELRRSLGRLENHRTVVIALFTGEEVGLAGSSHFVSNPPFPIERNTAMINLDMVGRLRDDTLIALGSESAPEWPGLIEQAAAQLDPFEVSGHGDGYGPSDHTSFYSSQVPVLHLFTGAHETYHTPDDDPKTVDPKATARVVRFTAYLTEELAREPVQLTYARSQSPGPTMSGDSRGYGAYLGTVPDYRAMQATEGGVLLSDVRTGGPADNAGIRGGDRIVEMAGTRIENLYDMTYALQDNRPGQTIEVVILRDDERVSLRATLGDRAQMQQMSESEPEQEDDKKAKAKKGKGEEKEKKPAETPSPHAPDPHAANVATRDEKQGVEPFFENRPGPEFVIGAGQPFTTTFEGERHLTEIRQLTFGGENAEGYFSPDGKQLIFQATPPDGDCDQQYILNLDTGETSKVSTGKGRTTCGYFDWPEADRIVYASTHEADERCPPPPDYSQGYVWALYEGFDLFEAQPGGSGVRRLTDTPGYDAEATWCHRGGKLVFTSVRDGDLDLYTMDESGEVHRLTEEAGYDGGAFYSPDCSEIVWRASRPQGEELEEYRRLLGEGLIRPHALEIYLMKADGSEPRQLTSNGAANFCPTFTADGSKIIYASNAGPGGGHEFDLWLIDKQGGEPEQITFGPGFDGFPQFSPDGRWLVWASNRAKPDSRETNLFIARWVH